MLNETVPLTDTELIAVADAARGQAYVPYSRFHVGAALLDEKNRLFTGLTKRTGSLPAAISKTPPTVPPTVLNEQQFSRRYLKAAVASGGWRWSVIRTNPACPAVSAGR